MTNKEILQANLLDILFENRNKAYGAYALRKNYNHRMNWALGTSLGVALLLVMINFIKGGNQRNPFNDDKGVVLTQIEVDKPEPKEMEKPKQPEQVKQVKYNDVIKIVPDDQQTEPLPDKDDMKDAVIGDTQVDGKPDDGTQKPTTETGTGNTTTTATPEPEKPVLPSFEAKYPGGSAAFAEFLKRYLVTPDELQVDEKQTVLVRFMVDVDGSISKAEIVQSGGSNFDKEVLRVLRKMPKWIPAQQNGMKVSSYFTQSVTFIGVEQ